MALAFSIVALTGPAREAQNALRVRIWPEQSYDLKRSLNTTVRLAGNSDAGDCECVGSSLVSFY